MSDKERAKRNLNPHKPARFAMWLWGNDYAKFGGGSMDFWDHISAGKRNMARDAVKEILNARDEEGNE